MRPPRVNPRSSFRSMDGIEKTCAYCIQNFLPSRSHPEQRVCSSIDWSSYEKSHLRPTTKNPHNRYAAESVIQPQRRRFLLKPYHM